MNLRKTIKSQLTKGIKTPSLKTMNKRNHMSTFKTLIKLLINASCYVNSQKHKTTKTTPKNWK